MDGKGRATDNAFIERFFRTLKWKHIYLHPASDGVELYSSVKQLINKYNRRRHQGINRQRPFERYQQAA
ncbi:MAG: transposase [Bacteroidetes bacterium]|jgi:putative transposase|nr:transposase [Bacteroidota bacterium]